MTRLTKTIAKEEMLGKVMARVATMNKDELGKLYDQLFGDVTESQKVEEPKNEVKEEPKAEEPKKTKPKAKGVRPKQILKADGFDRDLYEAHARYLGLWVEGAGKDGQGKVKSKKARQEVYASLYKDYVAK